MKEVKARKIELATVRLIIRTPQERDVHDIFVLCKGKKENGRKGLLPSARCLPLHTHGPLLFRPLHGLFGAAAAVEDQQIPRVLIKIALAGLEHGDHVFLRLILGVNLL